MTQVPLLKGDRVESADYRDALLVNMVAVKRDIKGANGYIINHQGLTKLGTGVGIDRGGVWNEKLLAHFRVSGNDFVRVESNGLTQSLGSTPGIYQASFAQSFNTQAIVADGRYYLYDDNNGLREITGDSVGDPIDITWIDGYYFFTDGDNLYHTDINDESVIDPLNFATSEFSPDPTLGVAKTQDNQVAAFNRYSTEWFINQASENFAFRRVAGKAVKAGIVGTHCKCEMDGSFFILGGRKEESPSIHMLSPGRIDSVSTREVDRVIEKYNENELAVSVLESRVSKRDMFIIVRLPNDTLLYNHTIAKAFGLEQAWTILKTGVNADPWRAVNGVFDPRIEGKGAWVYGDKLDNTIGFLDENVSTVYSEKQEFLFYSPFLAIDGASIDEIEIQTIPGFTDENATVSFSRTENGMTYGLEYFELYSSKQDYHQRYILRRLGYVRDFVGFKFRAVTSARMAFSGMDVQYG